MRESLKHYVYNRPAGFDTEKDVVEFLNEMLKDITWEDFNGIFDIGNVYTHLI